MTPIEQLMGAAKEAEMYIRLYKTKSLSVQGEDRRENVLTQLTDAMDRKVGEEYR